MLVSTTPGRAEDGGEKITFGGRGQQVHSFVYRCVVCVCVVRVWGEGWLVVLRVFLLET